ncbi:hypothetical protein TBR22_A24040 [Luteitalea sp. TBR-22]|uniref:exosortase-associated EpsI family protein n=1 Tax=Luteitalea sp. TBR-22 TaxID=2802971 RepID=UPI00351D449A|nr:hypothetical protein TBR22_A24040 [Luteitalea sp. TBR-22]
MLSARYATPVLVLLALALVPTVVNSYVGRKIVESPALRDALPEVLDGTASMPTDRRATTIKKEFDSEDWVEREFVDARGSRSVVLAVRSYDMKRLYHHPELAVSETDYERESVERVDGKHGPLDVHVLRSGGGSTVAAYALLFKGRTIGNPYLFQLTKAPELLLLGQRPLTLVFVEAPAGSRSEGVATPAISRLVSAVTALQSSPS